LGIGLSNCVKQRQFPEALDPAVVEAEIVRAKGIDLAKANPPAEAVAPTPVPPKEPTIAMAEPPKEPVAPKPEPLKEPVAPKPEPPKEPVAPKPEPPKEPVAPTPEPPKEPVAPKPEPPKEPVAPTPEPPKEPVAPKPEPPKEPVAPTPEPPKEPVAPKPEPPKEPVAPKPEPPKEPVAPKPEPPKEPVAPKPEPPKEPVAPKPEPPKEPVAPKPETPKEPVAPTPEPPKGVLKGGLFLVSPSLRKTYAAGERAEVTLVALVEGDIPMAAATLTMMGPQGESWTATDALGPLSAGRHSVTYGIDTACFAPGSYKVRASLGEEKSNAQDLVIAPSVPATHFTLAGWLPKPPNSEMDASRWSRFLGLNTVLVEDRSGWGSDGTQTMDTAFTATSRGLRALPDARPMEHGWAAPPFVRTADLLTAAGLRWVNACAVSGGRQGHLMPERELADPEVVKGAVHRVHQRLLAERRFRNFAGLLFTDESLLPRVGATEAATPFGVPSQLAAYKKFTGAKDVPWQQGSQKWDEWYPFLMFRAGILGEALAAWSSAAREAAPHALATSFLHSPTDLADGAYPPLQARGLPLITTTASPTGPAGMMMPAIAVDLQRLGHPGKPLWYMPQLADDADLDELRTALFLAVARKVDGLVYPKTLDYHLDRPALGGAAMDVQTNVSSVNTLLTRLGDFLLALEKPRDDVAILYSVTEHIDRIGRDPVKNPVAPAYPWTLISAYDACLMAHFPATFLAEEELLSGGKLGCKVILVVGLNRLRPEVQARLEQFIAAGGSVLTDSTTTVAIQGARPLGIEFPDLNAYAAEISTTGSDGKTDPALALRDLAVHTKLLYPLLGQLRTELKQCIERDYTSADPDIIVCDQRCGGGRYILLVNNTQRPDLYRGLKWELAAAQTKVTFREGNYTVYEATEGRRLFPLREKGHPTLALILPPGALRIYALLPEAIQGVRISRASLGRDGLSLAAAVHGEARSVFGGAKPLNAAVPIEITIADPAGIERLRFYRAHTPAGYQETLPFPQTGAAGRWTVTVRELLSGQTASATFRTGAGAPSWATRRGPLAVYDGEAVNALLRSSAPLLLVAGTEEELAKAETLAAALRAQQRVAEVQLAAPLAKPRALTKEQAATYVSAAPDNAPTPDIRQPAILLGEAATHPLIQWVHNSGVLPRTVTPDYPGPGGALIASALSAFEPGVPVVVAAASDAAGVDRAIEALLAASRGGAPATAWTPLAPSRPEAVAGAAPRAPRAEQLAVSWQHRGTDVPVCSAVPIQGNDATVGFYDGMVLSFNSMGKELWRRRCVTRTRAVARSVDGVWAALAGFPEVRLVSAQGRLQFEVGMEETYYRADYTALAITPDGTLTVAGTRRGEVLGYDLQGNKVFAIGEKDADEQKEGWQSRLGCINALNIALRTGVIVAGGELGTVALDPKGQELWASADLNRVTCIASSLGEEQTVAVGSRTGVVACVSGGTVLWRNQADSYITAVAFRGDTQEVLAACLDGTVTCYDKNGKALWTHRASQGFRFVASSVDGSVVAAAELTGKAVLLSKAGAVIAETPNLGSAITAMSLTSDGQYLIVGTAANDVLAFRHRRAVAEQDEL